MLVIYCGFVKQNFNFWSWKGEDQQIINKSGFLWAKPFISQGFLKEIVINEIFAVKVFTNLETLRGRGKKNHEFSKLLSTKLSKKFNFSELS